ncbi:putative nuclease HARBI1 [Ptychodera flava]|uniref:putative nuclease HARBI1 n=1 Tax=Ptychodera flava TaxID=63121 RepID=UPI00396A5140
MATEFEEFFILRNFFEDFNEDLDPSIFFQLRINAAIFVSLTCLFLRRKFVPRIRNFAEDVVPQYSLQDFCVHFRLGKGIFVFVLERIANLLLMEHAGGRSQVSPEKQLLVFIWYMVNQESIREVGHIFNLSKSTVHGIIKRVTKAVIAEMKDVIRWPTHDMQREISQHFQLQHGLPGIAGIIDGTHIRLSACIGGVQDYVNRKGYPSMQLQVIVDDNLLITNAYTGWPGCTHDARVLRNSSLSTRMETNEMMMAPGTYIIGDSAYPLRDWLITPFRDNGFLTIQQRRFNRAISSCRQSVERSIGHLKGRVRRLRELPMHDPEYVCETVIAGCIIHNLCIIHQDDVENYIDLDPQYIDDPNQYPNIHINAPGGVARRQQLMNALH